MLKNHKAYRARSGDVQVDRVDPVEACHLLRAWKSHFSARQLVDIDPVLLQLYAMMLLSMSLLLRFDELCLLRYVDRTLARGIYINASASSYSSFARRSATEHSNKF